MQILQLAAQHGPYAALAVASYVSAVVPFISAEVAVLGLVAGLPHPNLILLVAVATAAQMGGNSTMYWLGRRASGVGGGRFARVVDRWGHHFRGSSRSVRSLVFVSSASGLPPFSIVSTLAGRFRTNFVAYILVGSIARFLRFAVIGLFPLAVKWIAA